MATLAEQVINDSQGEKNAVIGELNSETLVACAKENLNALSKDNISSDSGILLCNNNSDDSKSTSNIDGKTKDLSKCSQSDEENLTGTSAKDNNQLSQKRSNYSQKSNASSCSTQFSLTPASQMSKINSSNDSADDNKCCSSSLTLKSSLNVNSDDVNPNLSTLTAKNSQSDNNSNSDDDRKSRSASTSLSTRSSPAKQSSQSSVKGSQNTHTDITEDNDSRSSFSSSTSKSTLKHSQTSQYSTRRSSPAKQSQSITKGSTQNDLMEDNDSCSSMTSSNSKSITKTSQPVDKSDSESNLKSSLDSPFKKNSFESKPKKYFSIVDSESEDDIVLPHISVNKKNSSDSDLTDHENTQSDKKSKIKSKRKLIDSDSEEDGKKSDDDSSEKENNKSNNKSNKFSSIIDTDSDSDEDNQSGHRDNASSDEENDTKMSKKGKIKSDKKRVGTVRASKDAAMQQIHSETQRLVRESQVSLPYHRPKQRTLQEFLNRKKVSLLFPQNLTSAEKVKMLSAVVNKIVQEKEKEAEEFYKSSESEEEEEDQNDKPMKIDQPDVNEKNENNNKDDSMDVDSFNISMTQKLTQDHIQDSHNKRSLLQQRSTDFGVPRKLFLDDYTDPDIMEKTETLLNQDEMIESQKIDVKRHKEYKPELKECSVPYKLFSGDEVMEICDNVNNTNIPVLEKENSESTKIIEESNKNKFPENLYELESSSEDFVLQMPETKQNVDEEKKNEINDENINNQEKTENRNKEMTNSKNQESIITETPIFINKEYTTLNKSSISKDQIAIAEASKMLEEKSMKETEDIVLEFPKETNNENEIIDKNILNDDFFKPPDFDESEKKLSLKEKILADAIKCAPMIKALPGSVIDFTSTVQMKEGVTNLMQRFQRHSIIPKHIASAVSEVKVLRTEGSGDDITVIEEVLPFSKTIMEDDYKKEKKPGEKLKILKEDLQRKIKFVRNEEWKQKEENENENEKEDGGKCKGDDFYADLPDEEEVLDDEESGESELEENDIPIIEKKRKKCEYADEEAEECSDEEEEEEEGNGDDIDEVEGEEGEEEEEDEEEDEGEEEEEDEEEEDEEEDKGEEETNKGPRNPKRIIKAFDEDDSNDSNPSLKNVEAKTKPTLERTKTDEDMFPSQLKSNFAIEDSDLLDSDAHSQACKTPLSKPNVILSMISPVNHLSVLNPSNDSARKSDANTPNLNLGKISTENTPLEKTNRPSNNCNLEKMMNLQKKLFEDPPVTVNDEELLEICSGQFTDSQDTRPPALPIKKQNEVTDSQLMDICSGSFITQTIILDKTETKNSLLLDDETSQDITLMFDEDSKHSPVKPLSSEKKSDELIFSTISKSPEKSVIPKSPVKFKSPVKSTFKCKNPMDALKSKNPMDAWLKKANVKSAPIPTQQKSQTKVTDSQILDICSGAFPSPLVDTGKLEKKVVQKSIDSQELLENKSQSKPKESELLKEKKEKDGWTGLRIASSSSSDEESKEATDKIKPTKKKLFRKKKVQKLELSDEEDEKRKEFSDLEEESEYEEVEEEEEDDEEKYIDYDSDENEVVVVPKKEIKKVAYKFLENEAELSESEWESEDEDERDLDKLEYEEGDAEDIDEGQVKDQLDRIHMKQVMDEDQREVKMLQELLFDDGDLHSEGAGRERKFRWKNVDSLGDDDDTGPKSDDNLEGSDDDIDVSTEVQMRKLRYEQQKFKEEKEKKLSETLDDDFGDSQLLKSGLKIVSVRSSKTTFTEQNITKSISDCSTSITINDLAKDSTKKLISSTKSLSFSNMRGSFLRRGDETLIRIANNLTEEKALIFPNSKRKFVFAHISPKVANVQDDSEQDNDTPDKDSKKRKRKIIPSQQTPTTVSKKMKIDNKKPGKKLF